MCMYQMLKIQLNYARFFFEIVLVLDEISKRFCPIVPDSIQLNQILWELVLVLTTRSLCFASSASQQDM